MVTGLHRPHLGGHRGYPRRCSQRHRIASRVHAAGEASSANPMKRPQRWSRGKRARHRRERAADRGARIPGGAASREGVDGGRVALRRRDARVDGHGHGRVRADVAAFLGRPCRRRFRARAELGVRPLRGRTGNVANALAAAAAPAAHESDAAGVARDGVHRRRAGRHIRRVGGAARAPEPLVPGRGASPGCHSGVRRAGHGAARRESRGYSAFEAVLRPAPDGACCGMPSER
jgi:hypothetical protein